MSSLTLAESVRHGRVPGGGKAMRSRTVVWSNANYIANTICVRSDWIAAAQQAVRPTTRAHACRLTHMPFTRLQPAFTTPPCSNRQAHATDNTTCPPRNQAHPPPFSRCRRSGSEKQPLHSQPTTHAHTDLVNPYARPFRCRNPHLPSTASATLWKQLHRSSPCPQHTYPHPPSTNSGSSAARHAARLAQDG